MASKIRQNRRNNSYGWPAPYVSEAPPTIIMTRDPNADDQGFPGQIWVNTDNDSSWIFVRNGVWTTAPAAGVGVFTSVTVDPGDIDVVTGDVDIQTGGLTVANGVTITAGGLTTTTATFNGAVNMLDNLTVAGNTDLQNTEVTGTFEVTGNSTFTGDVNITGDIAIQGDFDLSSNASIGMSSTFNGAEAVYLIADGGANETILIRSTQGTGADSLDIESVAGGVSIDGVIASNFTVTGAGQDLTLNSVGGSVLVSSTENAANAIRLHANGGVNETIQIHADQGTGVASVGLLSDVGGLTLRATGLASADAINLEAVAGGIDADAALQINIASSQAAATAIQLTASDAAGGINLGAGTGGITLAAAGSVFIVPDSDTQAGAAITIDNPVGKAIYTDLTTAMGATQVLTLTNATILTTSGILVSLSSLNASTNDALLTIDGITQAAGSIEVTYTNNGAGALGAGDNVILSFMVLN